MTSMASGGLFGGPASMFSEFPATSKSDPFPRSSTTITAYPYLPSSPVCDAKPSHERCEKNNVTHSCCPGALLQYIMGTTTHTKFEPWMSWVLKPLAVGVVMVLLYADLSCLPAMCCPMLYLYHSASGISHFMDHFFVSIGGTTRKTRVLSTAFLPYKCDISSAIWQPAWKCSS